MMSKITLGFIVGVFALGSLVNAGPPAQNPGKPFQQNSAKLDLLLDELAMIKSELKNVSEPLTQIVTQMYEWESEGAVRTFQICSTGPMMVVVCGDLMTSTIPFDSASISVSNLDAGFVTDRVTMRSNDSTDTQVSQCFTIGAAADETIRIENVTSVIGDPIINGFFTARTTPSAELHIFDSEVTGDVCPGP